MMRAQEKRDTGFTLIELLIVVAIIAILAAIAVPNFLEAQVRSKVSKSLAELASLAVALEAYHVDYDRYCPQRYGTGVPIYIVVQRLVMLTTPVPYITSLPLDPFEHRDYLQTGNYKSYVYAYKPDSVANGWSQWGGLVWGGPSSPYDWLLEGYGPSGLGSPYWFNGRNQYDPTNGTVSGGHIIRRGP